MSNNCIHHWLIPYSPDDTAEGYCLKCGVIREFINRWDDDEELVESNDYYSSLELLALADTDEDNSWDDIVKAYELGR